MKKYEYKEVSRNLNDRELNDLGADGWELVSVNVIPADVHKNNQYKLYHFKREKQPEPPKKDRDSFMYSSGI